MKLYLDTWNRAGLADDMEMRGFCFQSPAALTSWASCVYVQDKILHESLLYNM